MGGKSVLVPFMRQTDLCIAVLPGECSLKPRSGLLPTGDAVGDGLAGGEDAVGMPALVA